jgi:hypothetical protein
MNLFSVFYKKTKFRNYTGGIKISTQCEVPKEIPNMQLCYIAAYLRDWHFSVLKSQAADQADGFPVEADMIRLKDRIEDMKVQWDFLASLPLLDCPETHGCMMYEYPQLEELDVPENKDIRLIADMLAMMHFEWGSSQSARLLTGIQAHDYQRGKTYLDNIQKLIDEYISIRTPNDWPDAAPEKGRVGSGRTGVD